MIKPTLNQNVLGLFLSYTTLIASSVYFYSEKLKLDFNNKSLLNQISILETKNFDLVKANFELKTEISNLQQKFLDKNIEFSTNISKMVSSDSISTAYFPPLGQILAYTIALVVIIYSINHATNVILDFLDKTTKQNINMQEEGFNKVFELQKNMSIEITNNVSANTKTLLNPINELSTSIERVSLNSSLKHLELKNDAASGLEKIISSIKNSSSNTICDTVTDSFLENTTDSAGNLIEVIGSKTNEISSNLVTSNITVTQNLDLFANIVEIANNTPK